MAETSVYWNTSQKILFRFVFISFMLFIIIVNNGTMWMLGFFTKYISDALHVIIPWFAKRFLHLGYDITTFTAGSGDTTYDYVILLFIFCMTITGSIIWSIADRKRPSYQMLYYWLTVAARYYVGVMLINYGLVKVVKLQFPAPGLYRLNETYGESSPMGLAWTFLGFSPGYNMFIGIAELLSGLLLFRRTVAIGAFFTLMASANIMAVNYCYDVPVKIVSTALVLLSIFLLIPNISRLFRIFIKGEAVSLKTIDPPLFTRKWLRPSLTAIKYISIAIAVIPAVIQLPMSRKMYGDARPKSPLYGTYDIQNFILNKDTIPPDTREVRRWKTISFADTTTGTIRLMNDSLRGVDLRTDTTRKTILLDFPDESSNKKYVFDYRKTGAGKLELKGKLYGDSIHIEMKKKNFLLTGRGFHWINEYPLNK